MRYKPLSKLDLSGLDLAPPQLWKNVRLYPVLSEQPNPDLRFALNNYEDQIGVAVNNSSAYISYIPHGLVISWEGGAPQTTYGGTLQRSSKRMPNSAVTMHHRLAKKRSNQLRVLPLHFALEGFLNLQLGVPEIGWAQYSKEFKRFGVVTAAASTLPGSAVPGMSEAVNLFEIHENQVGTLVFISDTFAGAFIYSNPEDYRSIHHSLVENFYSDLFYYYGCYGFSGNMEIPLNRAGISNLADLESAVDDVYQEWEDTATILTSGLFAKDLEGQKVNNVGQYQLSRFVTSLNPDDENHLGEVITNQDNEIEYLSTYRLSKRQTRRAYFLKQLADHQWNLAEAAAAMGQTENQLMLSIEEQGFGYILNPEVLKAAHKHRRSKP